MNKKVIDYIHKMSDIAADNALEHSVKFTRSVVRSYSITQAIINVILVIWLIILTK